MRKSTIFTFFVVFCTLLLAQQIPGALAQVQCSISDSRFVYVDRQPTGSGALGASGTCEVEPTRLPTLFEATLLDGSLLTIFPIGINRDCFGNGLLYDLDLPKDAQGPIILSQKYGPEFIATLTSIGSPGYNHLDVSANLNFYHANAVLGGNSIVGNVLFDGLPTLLFDSPLGVCTGEGGKNYVVMGTQIPISKSIPPDWIPGAKVDCGQGREALGTVYIPVKQDPVTKAYYLTLTCGGPEIRVQGGNTPVPTFNGLGLWLFIAGVLGLGIWAMRRARFGNTLAGL